MATGDYDGRAPGAQVARGLAVLDSGRCPGALRDTMHDTQGDHSELKGRLRMDGQTESMECGYTSESLKMLESEEGQLNAVFACFGSAVQHAQLFEQGLTRFLTMYNMISSPSVRIEDIGTKMTMGRLLHKVSQHVAIDDSAVEEGFNRALEERNYLIHRFFLERSSELNSTEDRMQLLSDLVSIEANLERCRVLINAMRIAMCETLDIRDCWGYEYSS